MQITWDSFWDLSIGRVRGESKDNYCQASLHHTVSTKWKFQVFIFYFFLFVDYGYI